MKKVLVITLAMISFVYAKVNVMVSIMPQKTFVEEIGKDLVNVEVMVAPGQNPHSYEPKPSQMKSISKGDIYFYIGTEFENVWLDKFKAQNKKLIFADSAKYIDKIEIGEHDHKKHHEDEHEHEHENHHEHEDNEHDHEKHDKHEMHDEHHHHDGLDPHVWTSPSNIKVIAINIYETLKEFDTKNANKYEKNYNDFLKKVNNIDSEIKTILSDVPKNSTFLVFHPSWGYYANEYNLEQVAIEVDGKEPKPKELIDIIKEAKEEKIKAIFVQPEFSDKSAKTIAEELGIKVIKVSPLSKDWDKTLLDLSKAIANR